MSDQPKRRDNGQWGSQWSLEKKEEACYLYNIQWGSYTKVHQLTGVPVATLRNWSKTQWWADMTKEIRTRHNNRMDGKFTHRIDKLADEILDRLENGDEHVTPKGTVVRKKVSLRDCSDALQKLMQQRYLMRGEPTSRTEKREVQILEDKIAEYAKARKEEQAAKAEDKENVVH